MRKNNKKSKKKELGSIQKSKEDRLYENLLKITQEFMAGKGYLAMNESELFERLHLPEQYREIFGRVLTHLHQSGLASLEHKRYALKSSTTEIVKGTLSVHPRGFGFLKVENPSIYSEDIFIPKHLIQNAVDGDIVEVRVEAPPFKEKGPEGKVIAILERARTHVAGIIRKVDRYGEILAYVPLLGLSQRVIVEPSKERSLQEGDRIVMQVTDWGSKDTETYCKYSHYLGHISDPSCDVKAAIEEFGLRSDFSAQTIDEAKKIGTRVSAKDLQGREDFRKIECFTIDPDTAKDFDDAIHLSKDQQGHYHLGVHIADVSYYVTPGTALDREAAMRCNSTYFPGTCLPMLPSILSDNLCSLKPQVNRLTVSVLITFDRNGNEIDYRITRSVIKSKKRFTYKEAKQILEGKKLSPHAPTLHLMVELCSLLKKKRFERGSIEFALPELVILVDEKGMPQGTDYITYDITHQLVEEFMLKANEIVARHLTAIGKNLTYRVHDEPAEESMKEFAALARAFGYNLSDTPSNAEIQKLFEEAMNSSYGQYLATSYIRRMRLAIYSPNNIGHFGLGLTHYCHFTSPIRRYIDLVIHRSLFHEEEAYEALEIVANNCSEKERQSARAEASVKTLKKLRLLYSRQQIEPYQQYEAVVTRIKNFGIIFEVLDVMLESYLHVSELDGDYYIYDEGNLALKGRHTHKTFVAGDKITIMLKKVDFITLECSWTLIPEVKSTLLKSKKMRKPLPSRPVSKPRLKDFLYTASKRKSSKKFPSKKKSKK
ncbi:ribonuclease R [Neochlamydia sp. AcF95]|uniref:ribonuclease R n=1 Tax=Neochlamydia sp. AcF95 TaxID=2795734 RepID=UPI001BCA49F5|nr:ribonuclease R [Neochlamydia sp. AcF95]MBS4171116.1 Ribonuclease R [Neochlamydia sp. AcF95]